MSVLEIWKQRTPAYGCPVCGRHVYVGVTHACTVSPGRAQLAYQRRLAQQDVDRAKARAA